MQRVWLTDDRTVGVSVDNLEYVRVLKTQKRGSHRQIHAMPCATRTYRLTFHTTISLTVSCENSSSGSVSRCAVNSDWYL